MVWNAADASERAGQLEELGFAVDATAVSAASLRAMRADPPAAVVIDLGRAPSQGRDVGVLLRHGAATHRIPLVFVGGEGEKLDRVKALIPDAVYTIWSQALTGIRHAIDNPPAHPIRTATVFAAYSGKPLATRLGIRPGMRVGLAGAPRGFEGTIGELPEGATLRRRSAHDSDLLLWFPRDPRDLARRIGAMARRVPHAGLWIIWARRGTDQEKGLTQPLVRRAGLGAGLVDYRVARIDETRTGLRFTRRSR
ncbi:MAG: hypothetical protein L0271_05890 [Gemmatimonadetes bacterium]|nr:hypothetical protein [Gemmatimonadota bacterium]